MGERSLHTREVAGSKPAAPIQRPRHAANPHSDVVPDIVTRGYVLGWLHDALVAAGTEPAPATAPPAEGPGR